MIALVINREGAGIWVATILWYTCVVIPFRQIKKMLLYANRLYDDSKEEEEAAVVVDNLINYSIKKKSRALPQRRFEEMEMEGVELCCICLADMEKEHVVSQVSRCRHVFHAECIEQWIERDEITCPLCRSFLFDDEDHFY